jgi:hypothetical protein
MRDQFGQDVPAHIVRAFELKPVLTAAELAPLLGMHIATLRRHGAAGNLVGLQKGLGRRRSHRVFTLPQVKAFLYRPPDPPRLNISSIAEFAPTSWSNCAA